MELSLIVGLVVVVILAFLSLKIVPEYQRIVVLRLGKVLPTPKGPGLVVIIPLIDRPIRVDLRETFFGVPHQTCITRDNAPISIDFLIYSRVLDPTASVVKVQDFAGASQGIAATTLRAVIGDIPLDDVLAKREHINTILREKLDEVTERWGVTVTEAEGKRQASITVAEGEKQAAILRAEGEKQSAILRAEGYAQALEAVYA